MKYCVLEKIPNFAFDSNHAASGWVLEKNLRTHSFFLIQNAKSKRPPKLFFKFHKIEEICAVKNIEKKLESPSILSSI